MSLRITAGTWKGRTIPSPPSQGTRPSTDMWRGTIFSALHPVMDMKGAVVWDLYAGTGILGLECLSRGAEHCTFVERDRSTCKQLSQTVDLLNCSDSVAIHQEDCEVFLSRISALTSSQQPNLARSVNTVHSASMPTHTSLAATAVHSPYHYRAPHLVIADPPYALRVGNHLIHRLSMVLPVETLLVLEHGTAEAILDHGGWEKLWYKEKGATVVEFLRRRG